MTPTAQNEHQDLARAREKLAEAHEELDRIEAALGGLQALYDEYRRTYARARSNGASDQELAGIAERGKKVRSRVAKGHEYIPSERARLGRDEEALRAREEALERPRENGGHQEKPGTRSQEASQKVDQTASGRLRDGREVEEYRRLTRNEGLSAEEARERVILARNGGQPLERESRPETERKDAAPAEKHQHDQEDKVSMREAADMLGVSTTTVRRRIQRGELDAEKDPQGRIMVSVGEREREAEDEMER